MKSHRPQSVLLVVTALSAAQFAAPNAQAQNTNDTVQHGRVCINRTFQSGDGNDNATHQNCRINVNQTRQIGANNRNQTAQFGRATHNTTRQSRDYKRTAYQHARSYHAGAKPDPSMRSVYQRREAGRRDNRDEDGRSEHRRDLHRIARNHDN